MFAFATSLTPFGALSKVTIVKSVFGIISAFAWLAATIAASSKVAAFGDFSYYWVADRQGRNFKKLSELYAATDQTGFVATQRVDGKLILSEAIKVLKMKASA